MLETYNGYVYGVRIFSLGISTGLPAFRRYNLYGLYGQPWEHPTLQAECKPFSQCYGDKTSDVPHLSIYDHPNDARCGINMYSINRVFNPTKPDTLANYQNILYDGYCIAITQGSGKVVEHEIGYRVANAKILALLLNTPGDWTSSNTWTREYKRLKLEPNSPKFKAHLKDFFLRSHPSFSQTSITTSPSEFINQVKEFSASTTAQLEHTT